MVNLFNDIRILPAEYLVPYSSNPIFWCTSVYLVNGLPVTRKNYIPVLLKKI